MRTTKRNCLASLLALLCLPLATLSAADPPTEPQLRLEAGMHTAMIRRIATDAQGRFALTASDDKTARLWDVASGRPLAIYRPPLGPGNEGKLFACALSPDASTVAVGGWTKLGADSGHTIYIFDRASGRLTKRLTGLSNVLGHLAFSPDGRYLATVLGGSEGLLVFDLTKTDPPLADTAYGDSSYSLSWASDGRLATTCYDGKLRLYQVKPGTLTKLVELTAAGGKQPFDISFSPDGLSLLIGYKDVLAVEVRDGHTLKHRQSLEVPSGSGNLGRVAWTADGRFAMAGGTYGNPSVVRSWSSPDFANYTDTSTTSDTIMSLVRLPGGRLLLGSGEPAWGVLGSGSRWEASGLPPIADLRGQQAVLGLGTDGRSLQFGYQVWGNSPWSFSLSSRQLKSGALPAPTRANTTLLPVRDWKDTRTPSLNGNKLPLDQYEMSRSLAIAPNAASFVLGTEWRLRAFEADGKERWSVQVPGVVWAVTIDPSGSLVLAAYSDGTIRWHRLSDGVELLAFFPHADQKRWVLWTPSGYFDASAGGEELIGWHLNRGQDSAADFFPASRFRERFYRPDIIDRVLATMSESEAVKQADIARGSKVQAAVSLVQSLPPVIDLVSPAEMSSSQVSVTLRYRVRSPADAPVTDVRSRINGQSSSARALIVQATAGAEQSITVTIPPADSEIQLFAENKNGVSVPATVRIRWTGAAETFVVKPKLYLLAVGVGAYQHTDIPKLNLAAKDARDFASTMQKQAGKLYREVEVKILTDASATRDDVVDGLDWLQKSVTQHDLGMLFLSGHGLNDPTMGYIYLPVNADPDKLKRSAVSMSDIQSTLASLAGKAVFFLDSCHSGNVLGKGRKGVENDIVRVVNELSSAENGVVVFSSSTGRQYSLESPEWGNGAFTKALIEGLSGKADYQGSGRITFKMLDLYVSERVKDLTKGQQSPVTQAPGGVNDFPLALK